MSTPHELSDNMSRLEKLLADRAIFGLDTAEAEELARLLESSPGAADEYDLLAANVWLAQSRFQEAPPIALCERLVDSAPGARRVQVDSQAVQPPGWRALVFAIAASLLIGLYLGSPQIEWPVNPTTARSALIASDVGAITVAWSATEDPAAEGVSGEDRAVSDWGDVVWSDVTQTGYMRFRGLAVNNPRQEQYQLWIFDAERDDKHPVDGGVFNITDAGEGKDQVVPIEPKLSISKAVMFAITVEKPGGVVVSDRSRLPLLAQLKPAPQG